MDIKRTVVGVGYNSGGKHIACFSGVRTNTYAIWYNMLTRCYSSNLHKRCPQYAICQVDDNWHDFQEFAEWYENHNFSGLGYHLDKDLLFSGNTTYGSKFCCLLPQELNKLITTGSVKRKSMTGTYWHPENKRWIAAISVKGKQVHLGSFEQEIDAHKVYVKEKEFLVRSEALRWKGRIEERAYQALMSWKIKDSPVENATETTRS